MVTFLLGNRYSACEVMAKEHILIVEDEEDILELVKYNLSKEGYHAVGAISGEEALKKVDIEPPDLVLLELMLPGVDGLEVCRVLKNDPKTNNPLAGYYSSLPGHIDEGTGPAAKP